MVICTLICSSQEEISYYNANVPFKSENRDATAALLERRRREITLLPLIIIVDLFVLDGLPTIALRLFDN